MHETKNLLVLWCQSDLVRATLSRNRTVSSCQLCNILKQLFFSFLLAVSLIKQPYFFWWSLQYNCAVFYDIQENNISQAAMQNHRPYDFNTRYLHLTGIVQVKTAWLQHKIPTSHRHCTNEDHMTSIKIPTSHSIVQMKTKIPTSRRLRRGPSCGLEERGRRWGWGCVKSCTTPWLRSVWWPSTSCRYTFLAAIAALPLSWNTHQWHNKSCCLV